MNLFYALNHTLLVNSICNKTVTRATTTKAKEKKDRVIFWSYHAISKQEVQQKINGNNTHNAIDWRHPYLCLGFQGWHD